MTDQPIITIVFRPTHEGDITVALRALLKRALRCYGLRPIKIEIAPPGDHEPWHHPAAERGIVRS